MTTSSIGPSAILQSSVESAAAQQAQAAQSTQGMQDELVDAGLQQVFQILLNLVMSEAAQG